MGQFALSYCRKRVIFAVLTNVMCGGDFWHGTVSAASNVFAGRHNRLGAVRLYLVIQTLFQIVCHSSAHGFDMAWVDDVSILQETSHRAVISIAHTGDVDLGEELSSRKLVIFVRNARSAPGAHAIEGSAGIIKEVRWSHHSEEGAVWVVVEARQIQSVDLVRSFGRIHIYLNYGMADRTIKSPILTKKGRAEGIFKIFNSLPQEIIAGTDRHLSAKCPVSTMDLSYLQISHWDFEESLRLGELIVHKAVAQEVLDIFEELFRSQFPIQRMHLISEYAGDDDRSMRDNNTSAFNCRPVRGENRVASRHSYGLAIDINPLINPYVKDGEVSPPEGERYADRRIPAKGKILKGGPCYRAFKDRGWDWGGDWRTLKDYQHFEREIHF